MTFRQGSLDSEIRDLAERVRVLELENRDLRGRVDRLERGAGAQAATSSTPPTATSAFVPPARTEAAAPQTSTASSAPAGPTLPRRSLELSDTRREAAVSVGHFFRRCLQGQPRGLSGRERVDLASRVYVLVRDFEDKIYDPVRVFNRWGDIKPLVSRSGNQLGDSVFAGFPTVQEAQIAVSSANLIWPRNA